MGDRAAVIGGGVGGLTAAIALRARGWDVTVFEQAPELAEVGAGIAIAPNALTALDAIGVGGEVRSMSALQGEAGIRRTDGRWLSRTSAEEAEARYGNPTVVLHRAALLSVLAGAVPPSAVRLGAQATLVDPAAGLVAVDGGEPVAYDLVVAADGLRSGARRVIFPASPEPVYAGVTSWRMVVSVPSAGVLAGETWGRGKVFGTATLADGRIYCYATAVAPPDGRAADEKDELRSLFAGWHDPIPSLVEAADTVLRTDIRCLPSVPPRFHSGRTALLGDAAHAMTPNLGQGGCQAIEDAAVLAYEVGRAPVAGALPAYSAARRDRTASVAARSRRIADLTRVANPAAVALRDGGMWLAGRLGPNLVMRQMDDVMTWRPPA